MTRATHASSPTLLVAGGGSAGHVSPMLATARAFAKAYPHARVVALGTSTGLEAHMVPEAGFELLTIEKVPFPRKPSPAALAFPLRLVKQIRTVRALMREHSIQAVAGFGGYVCPPAYLAAALSRVPIIIHEANKRPGLANILGARFAKVVASAFPPEKKGAFAKATHVGMPMREEISVLDRSARRSEARRAFGLDPERPTLLVTGGSLGAARLNDTLIQALPRLEELGVQVLHITGKGKAVDATGELYRQVEFVTSMEEAYSAADFAVTRSGAGTVCELAVVGLPALFVPLPIGNGEQALNGAPVVSAGGARMVSDADLTPEILVETVRECLLDTPTLTQMSEAVRAFARPNAASELVDLIVKAAPALAASTNARGESND